MAIAGSLTYDTKLDTKGFQSGLNKIGGIAKGVAVGVGGSIAAIGTGLSVLVKNAVDNYAEYEQLTGGVKSMFGGIEKGAEQIKKVTDTANEAWKNLTMSQNDYYKNFTSTYPLMKNDIEDQNEAIEQTNRLMKLESDLANTFGYSVEEVSTAINWALKGSFNYIDNLNLGIKGTQEGFLEAAHKAGYMVDSVEELTSSDILDILEKTAEQYGVLGKTAEEAMKTIQGSTKATKAAWTNLVTGIADDNADFDKLVNDFVDSISAMFDNLIPRILTSLEGIGKLIPKLIKVLMDHLPEIIDTGQDILNALLQGIVENIPQMTSTITQVILSLVNFITQNLPTILQAGITILLELIKGITQALPDLIPMMVKVIMDMVNILLDNIDLIIECGIQLLVALAEGIMNALPELISRLPEIIIKLTTKLIELAPQLWSASLRIMMALIEGMIKYIPEMISRIPQIIKSMINAFKQGLGDFINIGKNLLKGIWEGISNTKEWLVNKIKDIGKTITGAFKKIFGIHSPSKLFRDEIGKNLILGVGVAFEKDDSIIDKQINDFGDDVYKKMQGAVNMETGKMAFSGTTGSISQILSSNATFDGNFVVKAEVQEGTLFEANQRITKEKRLQTGFGG
ncbi:MAG: hypothetical protein PUJ51_25255 [Clostridiales bacterium]|uniref:hypothetical protein n=1 Tax=Terrisporobacter sp. TaxID=1965305 RepID=UPI002A560145|nr:hypothetical protein [Terrisporobacter sp.]MDD7757767.1 hypothetical protein [Clostridiales bacterium]MDY4134883.1 hypothetical protein [Terrisporobacter sp.]